jgi:hypothetical protein
MGQAKVRRSVSKERFARLDRELTSFGINTDEFGFYDQPKFLAEESEDNYFLEKYGEWVALRDFDKAYATHVMNVVPRLTKLVQSEFVEYGFEGGCVAASGMISRMLDRLGVWSVAVTGSLTLDVNGGRIRRMFHSVDEPDFPGAALGHSWIIAPPYRIVDATISLQHWSGDEMGRFVPPFVLASEEAKKIRPVVKDVVSNKLRTEGAMMGWSDSDLHYRLLPRLRDFGVTFPASEISQGRLTLRYVPVAIKQTDVPLEFINTKGGRGRPAIDFWHEKVVPEFSLERMSKKGDSEDAAKSD